MLDTTDSRAPEMFNTPPTTMIILVKLYNNLYKNKMFQEVFSVEELKIYFNGKQLHSSVI